MVAYKPAYSRAAKAPDGADSAPTETLNLSLPTPRQRMRQEAVLTATLELLHEFGFDGAKIQDIAGRSGVALATIYRYFGSRDCLIYEATLRWTSQIVMNARDLAIEESLDELLINLVRRVTAELIKEPNLLAAWARANISPDPEVAKRVRERASPDTFALDVFEGDQDLVSDLTRMTEYIWFGGVVRWALNRQSYEEVQMDLERVVLLLLKTHHPSSEAHGRSDR